MHKNDWRKAGRPISSEVGSISQKLSKRVCAALRALRPTFQRYYTQTLRRHRIYIDPSLNGPLVTLDGPHGLVQRLRGINRWITHNFPNLTARPMASFDLSECYSKLNQQELLRIMSRMISRAFTGKPYLAIATHPKTGRWIANPSKKHTHETLYKADTLFADVKFLVTNAYIE